jgi:NADPH2:quinone reductase
MYAVWYEKAGKAGAVLVAGDMPDPEPGPGEVRVRIAVSAVNPTDVKRRREGRELGRFPRIVPNNDGAGTIDRVGPGVPETRLGERVWIFGAQAGRPFGTAAEFTVVPARQAIPLPANTSFEDGACLGVPAVTAHYGLFADGPLTGKTALVTGGAGRVGAYAVQLAKRAGATVIATVGSAAKAETVRGLGADHVLNYKTDDLAAEIRRLTDGQGVDRIVEVAFGTNIALAPKIMKTNGVIATYASDAAPEPTLPFYSLMFNNTTIRPFIIYALPHTAQDRAFAAITAALKDGVLQHRIAARLPLARLAEAHEAIEAGTLSGSVLVDVGS